MKQWFKRTLCIGCCALLGMTALGAAGCTPGGSTGEGGRVIYNGGDGMNDNKLTIFRWNFGGINTARKQGSPVYTKLSEAAGMPLYSSTASGADWTSKLNTMFGTQMLPDIFVSKGPETPKQYSDMIADGVLIPVSDYVSETEYPNIYNHLKKFDYLKNNLSYSQGKHWSIPVDWSLEHTMYIRNDWLDNLNRPEKLKACIADEQGISVSAVTDEMMTTYRYKEPADLVEFYRLCRAFTVYDPDGNGLNDTYGYTSSAKDDLFSDSWLFLAFDGGYNYMTDYDGDGNYEPSFTTEGTKKAIAYFNELLKKGYIDPAWNENDADRKQQALAKGKVGMMEAHAWFNNIITAYISANTTATYKPTIEEASEIIGMFPPPAGEKGTYGISGNPNFWTVTCLNAGMSDKEFTAALKLIDYMLSDEGKDLLQYGIEGVHFEYQGEERVSLMGKKEGWNNTLSQTDTCFEISSVTNWSTGYFEPYQTNADKIIPVMEKAKEYVKHADYPFLSTPAYVKYWDVLIDYSQTEVKGMMSKNDMYTEKRSDGWKIPQSFAEIGIPSAALTADFTTFTGACNGMGASEITTEYNQAIATATKYVRG